MAKKSRLACLTVRTNVRSTAGGFELDDGRAAARAGFAFTPEYTGKTEIAAAFSLGVDIVFVGAAALFDGRIHDTAQLVVQLVEFFWRDRMYQP